MIKNIIFDFDGTIADNFDKFSIVVNEITNREGYNTTLEEVQFIMRHKGMKDLIEKLKLSKYQIFKFTYFGRKEFKKSKFESKPFNEIIPVLKQLQEQGYKLGIISSNTPQYIKNFLKKHNIEIFDFIIKTSLFGKDKSILKTLKKHNLKKSETIYIGDEKRDIRACRKIGLKEIAVSYGYSSKMLLKEENPRVIIDSPNQIIPTINKLTSS